ncbi:MAG: DUF3619 family protein [Burkholderiaceae bacterium]|jgi:hypothetical protein|nr:DUF3619 family protein [Burkholderiaceae bacterium]
MTTSNLAALQNRIGLRIAARLTQGAQTLPHDISERLRAARMQALARQKQAATAAELRAASAIWGGGSGATATAGLGDEALGLWGRLASAALMLAMAVTLVMVIGWQDDNRMAELAEIDSALLTDDLPPIAYTDAGFMEYLRLTAPSETPAQYQ